MKCSICSSTSRGKMVYCSMCESWHCVAHFNSALIHRPGRAMRSPLVLQGMVEVHGNVVEATYQGAQLRLFLAEVAAGKYLVKMGDHALGMVVAASGPVPSWSAYVDEALVGQRETIAGAVGCVVDGSVG